MVIGKVNRSKIDTTRWRDPEMKILEGLKAMALFLVAAGLFAMSYVIYDVMGRQGRYTPVGIEEDLVIVMDTHTGQVWGMSYDAQETGDPKTIHLFSPPPLTASRTMHK
jgi:hypothetical protein